MLAFGMDWSLSCDKLQWLIIDAQAVHFRHTSLFQQWWVAFHDLSGEVVRWKYSFHWRMEHSQITLDLDRFESFCELHYCTPACQGVLFGRRFWADHWVVPRSRARRGDGDTLRFGVAKCPQQSVRCRKSCASWRINMNQLINYLSARAGFRRKEFNGINGYEKSIKTSRQQDTCYAALSEVCLPQQISPAFFWYSCMWRCDALFGSYKIHWSHLDEVRQAATKVPHNGFVTKWSKWTTPRILEHLDGWRRRGGSKVNVVKVQNRFLQDLDHELDLIRLYISNSLTCMV